jgi:hypothetical protein
MVMNIKGKLIPILEKFAHEAETGNEVGESPLDLSSQLISNTGWIPVRDAVLEILEDRVSPELREGAINVLYSGIKDGSPLEDKNRSIALMFACMNLYPTNHPMAYSDTVWSLVVYLKKVGMASEYDPLEDPEIKPIYQSIMKK